MIFEVELPLEWARGNEGDQKLSQSLGIQTFRLLLTNLGANLLCKHAASFERPQPHSAPLQ
jgi:hypothetical protein